MVLSHFTRHDKVFKFFDPKTKNEYHNFNLWNHLVLVLEMRKPKNRVFIKSGAKVHFQQTNFIQTFDETLRDKFIVFNEDYDELSEQYFKNLNFMLLRVMITHT